jgi:tetratricopeptide (TPR) repeat protein
MEDRSVRAGDVRRSVIVTGDGNVVALSFGDTGIRLPLRRKQFPPPERRRRPAAGEPPRELDLLVPEAGKLPLIGRKDLFSELQAWLDDEVDISVHAVIGRAGTGKTRLALEFCGAIDRDPDGHGEWIAGFLSPSDLSAVAEALTMHSFKWEQQTLLVVDYAAQCHQALARWLDRLADQKLYRKLRLLLLDREAPEAFGWWHELTTSGPPSRRDLFYMPRPRQLPDLSAPEERRALMAAALQAARELRPGASTVPPIPVTDEDPDFDRRLAQPQFGNPLNLVIAGVIALDHGPGGALALRRLDAARQIARRELRRLTDLARSRYIGEDEMRHIVAFNGLAGGLPIAGLRQMVADELAATHRSTNHLSELLVLLQQELSPRAETAQQPHLATIQPDLIGEAAIVEAFTGDPAKEAEAPEIVCRAYAQCPEPAAQALVRLAQDFAYPIEDPLATDEEKATGGGVMSWLLNLAQQLEDPEQLVSLAIALPYQTTILRELATELTQKLAIYAVYKTQQSKDLVALTNAAGWLNNLAVRLSSLGRREDALAAAEVAVLGHRALVEAQPEAFRPDLAMSLNTLATMLSDLGRREEALAPAEETVRLYGALAEAHPAVFTSDLARSLNNLAIRFSDLGQHEEALAAAQRAVRLYHSLREESPDALTPDLARSLNTLGNMLGDLGRNEEALEAAQEAVRLRRGLAQVRPDAFIPDLAMSLNNLAIRLGRFGRPKEALGASEEAIVLYRALTAARPDAFIPELAASLCTLAKRLSDLRRREEALTAAEEAVRLDRALAEARPDAFNGEFARSLHTLGDLYAEAEKRDLALATLAEAMRLLTPTFLSVPAAVKGIMAGILKSYLLQCETGGWDLELLRPVIEMFLRSMQEET